jgi:hypothetical protein
MIKNIVSDGGSEASKVECQEVKLKGYSKFRFLAAKIGKYWSVHEYTTGRCVSVGYNTNLAVAKKTARTYLDKHTGQETKIMKEQISMFEALNGESTG